jgi:L-fuculose-phosphate aldolase
MLLATERGLIAEFGRRMAADRLVVGTSGNLSVRSGDLLAVTPAGHAYETLTPELVCVQRLDGAAVEGELAPSSELPIHQLIYAHTDAAAVVHTHSTAATVVSTVVDELPTIHYILAVMGGPIRVAPYARFGSRELAANVLRAIEGRSGVLLANHGAVTYGPTIQAAYDRALYLEWVAEVWLRAHALAPAFTPRVLGEAEMAEVYAKIQGTYATGGHPRKTGLRDHATKPEPDHVAQPTDRPAGSRPP